MTKSKTKTSSRPKAAPKSSVVAAPERAADANDNAYARLKLLNKWLAGLYGIQALALLLLSLGRMFPVYVHFLGVDTLASQSAGHTLYATATHHLFDVSLPELLAWSLAISAAIHGTLFRWLWPRYKAWLALGLSPMRWLDNAFSASLLPVAIGVVAGLSDLTSLLMLFVLGFATHILGLYMESYNQRYTKGSGAVQDYRPFVLLCITGATAWLVLGGAILSAVVFGAGLPPGVWIAYLVGVICVGLFAYIMLRSYRRAGRWADYRNTEAASMILSFVAKSVIAWLLFSAVLSP